MTFDEPDSRIPEEGIRQKSTTWPEVDHFIRKEDERVYLFVLNQLRKKLGNRQPLTKKKVKKTISSVQIRTEKINQLFEKIDTVNQRGEDEFVIESQLTSFDKSSEKQGGGQFQSGLSEKHRETKPAGDTSNLREGVVSLSCQNPYLKLLGVDLKHRNNKETRIKLGLTQVEVNERQMQGLIHSSDLS